MPKPARPKLTEIMEHNPASEAREEAATPKVEFVQPDAARLDGKREQRKQGKRSLGWVQLNVQVPEELRTRVKIKALQEGTDVSDVVTALLQNWVKKT